MRRERGRMRRSGDQPRQSNQPKTSDREEHAPQYQMFLLTTRADTSPHEQPFHFPTNARMTTYLVNTQSFTRLLRREPPYEKDNPTSSIVGAVQDNVEDGVCERFPSLFCVRVGLVSADGEAGIEPEDTRLSEGREVSGWVPSRFRRSSVNYTKNDKR